MRRLIDQCRDLSLVIAYTSNLVTDLARTHRPDLIILDFDLPGGDGVAVLDELKGCDETRHLPVVAVTEADPSAFARAEWLMEAGVSAHLTKPIQVRSFKKLLSDFLPGGDAPSPTTSGSPPA
jgi:two-component system cell cycle response regulator DivK